MVMMMHWILTPFRPKRSNASRYPRLDSNTRSTLALAKLGANRMDDACFLGNNDDGFFHHPRQTHPGFPREKRVRAIKYVKSTAQNLL